MRCKHRVRYSCDPRCAAFRFLNALPSPGPLYPHNAQEATSSCESSSDSVGSPPFDVPCSGEKGWVGLAYDLRDLGGEPLLRKSQTVLRPTCTSDRMQTIIFRDVALLHQLHTVWSARRSSPCDAASVPHQEMWTGGQHTRSECTDAVMVPSPRKRPFSRHGVFQAYRTQGQNCFTTSFEGCQLG